MARCSGCDGKFGSNGEPEAEVQSEDITDNQISVEVEINVPCGNCGNSPWKQGYVSLEAEVDLDTHDTECTIEDPNANDKDGKPVEVTLESDPDRFRELADTERTFELGSIDIEVTDDYRPKYTESKNRKTGEVKRKPVPSRFQKHWYDIQGTAEVTCSACSGVLQVDLSEESITASELEVVD